MGPPVLQETDEQCLQGDTQLPFPHEGKRDQQQRHAGDDQGECGQWQMGLLS